MAILVPAQAVSVAKEVTALMRTTGASRPFGDCNAVSPMSAAVMASIIGATDGDYIDGGIIGSSPAKRVAPGVYTPGPRPDLMDELDGKSIAVRNMVPNIGRASSIKMCYVSMTKVTNALRLAMLTPTEALGLYDELIQELAYSQGEALSAMEYGMPGLPANAGRWVGEMGEIAETFGGAESPPDSTRARRRYSGCCTPRRLRWRVQRPSAATEP